MNNRGVRLASAVIVMGLCSHALALDWTASIVDAGTATREHIDIAMGPGDSPIIAYTDYSTATVEFAFQTPSGWTVETVPAPFFSHDYKTLDVLSDGTPALAYAGNGELYYGARHNGAWDVRRITSASDLYVSRQSMAIDRDDNPVFALEVDGKIVYGSWDGNAFAYEEIDNAGFGWMRRIKVQVDSTGRPSIVYMASMPGSADEVRYAAREHDGTWSVEGVQIVYSGSMYELDFDLGSDDRPHISFQDDNYGLYYATLEDGNWVVEGVSGGRDGRHNSIAVDGHGNVGVLFLDYTYDHLKYAHKGPAGWQIEEIPQTAYKTIYPVLTLDSAGLPHVAYHHRGASAPAGVTYRHGIPEPASIILLGAGCLGVLLRSRRAAYHASNSKPRTHGAQLTHGR